MEISQRQNKARTKRSLAATTWQWANCSSRTTTMSLISVSVSWSTNLKMSRLVIEWVKPLSLFQKELTCLSSRQPSSMHRLRSNNSQTTNRSKTISHRSKLSMMRSLKKKRLKSQKKRKNLKTHQAPWIKKKRCDLESKFLLKTTKKWKAWVLKPLHSL